MIQDVSGLAVQDRNVVIAAIRETFERFDVYAPDDVAVHPKLGADFSNEVNGDLPNDLQLSQYACSKRLLALRKKGTVRQTTGVAKRKRLPLPKLSIANRERVEGAIREVYGAEAFREFSPDEVAIHPERAVAFLGEVQRILNGAVVLDQFACAKWLLRLRKQGGMRQTPPR